MAQTNSDAITTTQTTELANFILSLSHDAIPSAVSILAKEHLLDGLGIALASSRFDFGAATLLGVQELGEGSGATPIGSGRRLPAASAALVNGVLAHGLDFDDTHIGAIYHATAPALAAVLAAGQAHRSSGADVLAAFVGALEIGCRLATVGTGDFHDRAYHPTSLCGTFAAAAAAGRLAGADTEKLVWALGICGSQAAGVLERGTSWLKRLHPGWAAHSGLAAVSLASAGFSGPDTMLEGRRGFYSAHIQRVPEGGDLPAHGLGEQWQTLGIALKPYPCCHFIHAFVDAALELHGQFSLEEIEKIECPLTLALHKMVAEPRSRCIHPTTSYQALFSVQYVVAAALARGRVDLSTFYDEPLDSPEVLEVAAKTYCVADPESDYPAHFPGEVVVQLKDGHIFRCRKPASLGTSDVPLDREAILEKFMKNATRAISLSAARELAECVLALEKQDSLEHIMALCVSSATAPVQTSR